MRRMRNLMLVFLAALALLAWIKHEPEPAGRVHARVQKSDPEAGAAPAKVTIASAPAAPAPAPAPADADALPPEVAQTRALIEAGGPFPFDRDGIVFGNYEGLLPARERGWYHEYTVPTPGVGNRGARRIVTGGTPPSEWWYTDDHYESFVRLER
jgi:guanyl-specific ribonuclease Sa